MVADHSIGFYILMLLGMFAVTFGIRFALYARADKVVLPEWVEQALRFVPVAVLTAIIMPMILLPDNANTLLLDWRSPWLVGSLAAFAVGLLARSALLTIAVGLLVFFMMKLFF